MKLYFILIVAILIDLNYASVRKTIYLSDYQDSPVLCVSLSYFFSINRYSNLGSLLIFSEETSWNGQSVETLIGEISLERESALNWNTFSRTIHFDRSGIYRIIVRQKQPKDVQEIVVSLDVTLKKNQCPNESPHEYETVQPTTITPQIDQSTKSYIINPPVKLITTINPIELKTEFASTQSIESTTESITASSVLTTSTNDPGTHVTQSIDSLVTESLEVSTNYNPTASQTNDPLILPSTTITSQVDQSTRSHTTNIPIDLISTFSSLTPTIDGPSAHLATITPQIDQSTKSCTSPVETITTSNDLTATSNYPDTHITQSLDSSVVTESLEISTIETLTSTLTLTTSNSDIIVTSTSYNPTASQTNDPLILPSTTIKLTTPEYLEPTTIDDQTTHSNYDDKVTKSYTVNPPVKPIATLNPIELKTEFTSTTIDPKSHVTQSIESTTESEKMMTEMLTTSKSDISLTTTSEYFKSTVIDDETTQLTERTTSNHNQEITSTTITNESTTITVNNSTQNLPNESTNSDNKSNENDNLNTKTGNLADDLIVTIKLLTNKQYLIYSISTLIGLIVIIIVVTIIINHLKQETWKPNDSSISADPSGIELNVVTYHRRTINSKIFNALSINRKSKQPINETVVQFKQ
ncbi:uncharacterized protein LOC128396891 [Panonychus citri]|uniref:uncharacterized protein LOC128396891 n=1 Tax=Panonychus citri TaxID=50023 RepID=UPI002307D98C|nr:uncharacterized protein LOC128396891 [Panonychus citri]